MKKTAQNHAKILLLTYWLSCVAENFDQMRRKMAVFLGIVERRRLAEISAPSSSADSMNVFFDFAWQLVINDVLDFGNVEPTSGDTCGH